MFRAAVTGEALGGCDATDSCSAKGQLKMEPSLWPLLCLFGLILAWLALTRLGKISRARAHELAASGALLVDVRTESEFESGHVPGAVNAPLDRLSKDAPSLVKAGKPIVVYCASGVRSASAKRTLRAAGAAQVYDLGGMGRW
jgi:phage shock protein E